MNISIIWKLSADENSNLITLQCLKEQIIAADLNVQVLIYQKENDEKNRFISELETLKIKADKYALINENSLYEHAQKHVTGDIITYLNGGDRWTPGTLRQVQEISEKYSKMYLEIGIKMGLVTSKAVITQIKGE